MEDTIIENADNEMNESKNPEENITWCIHCGNRIIVNTAKGDMDCSKCKGKIFWDLNCLRSTAPTITRINIESLLDLKIGDEFSYGRSSGWRQLNWRVIDVSEGKIEAILLDKFNDYVDKQPYNEDLIPSTWKTCTLRKYLNEEYIYAVFSEEERSRIIETQLVNENNSVFGTKGGDPTTDKVFILSASEAKKLIADDYCKGKKWWLRTPGYSGSSASFYSDGVDDIGTEVNDKKVVSSLGVCPVIWIDITGIPRYNRESSKVIKSNYNKGDELEFGFDPHRGSIKWKVLDVKGDRALVITKDIFREKIFDKKPDDEPGFVSLWENCILRKWMNAEFLNAFFTEDERKRILVTNNPNNNVEKYDKSIVEAHVTNDKVFLLSEEEAKSYFSSNEERCCENCAWLLRDTSVGVDYTGEIKYIGSSEYYNGVRPAMWINCSV